MSGLSLIHYKFGSISTTQEAIKKYEEKISPDTWVLCTAEEQTKGKGTHNRRWASPPDVNIYATYGFLFPCYQVSTTLRLIPQVTAYAVAVTLQNLNIANKITLKWINDVLVDKQKICGILCESSQNFTYPDYQTIYLGVGLNVNMSKEICNSLDQPVTSLYASTGKVFDKASILDILNKAIQENISLLIEQGLRPLHQKIATMLEKFDGEEIYFDTEDNNFKPRAFKASIIGVDSQNQLIVKPHERVIGAIIKPASTTYIDVSPSSSHTLSFFTGRILRGKEVITFKESQTTKKDEKAIAPTPKAPKDDAVTAVKKTVLPDEKSLNTVNVRKEYRLPVLGGIAIAAAVTMGFMLWSKSSSNNKTPSALPPTEPRLKPPF